MAASPRHQQGPLWAADSLGASAEQLAGRARRHLSKGLSARAVAPAQLPWPSNEQPPEGLYPPSAHVRLLRPHANLQLHCTSEQLLVQPCDAPDGHPDSAWLCVDRASAHLRLLDAPTARATVARAASSHAGAYSTERAFGVIGVLRLLAGPYLALISEVEPVGRVLGCAAFQVVGVRLVPFTVADDLGLSADQLRSERQYAAEMGAWLQSGAFFFSYCLDLTRPLQDALQPAASADGRAEAASARPLWQRADSRFFFNWHASRELMEASLHAWVLPLIQGYVQVAQLDGAQLRAAPPAAAGGGIASLQIALVARRSRLRAGQRFHTRGADGCGHVGNYVETEQIVVALREPAAAGASAPPSSAPAAAAMAPAAELASAPASAPLGSARAAELRAGAAARVHVSSYVQVRGSIPLRWQQPTSLFGRNGGALRFATSALESLPALETHLRDLVRSRGRALLLNLAGEGGAEGELTEAYRKLAHIADVPGASYVGCDWHREARAGQADALRRLLQQVEGELAAIGEFALDATAVPFARDGGESGAAGGLGGAETLRSQRGVVRTNCIDCLDRTNQVQTALARRALEAACASLGLLPAAAAPEPRGPGAVGAAAADRLQGALPALDGALKDLWANHGDAIAIQYTGTGALKSDVTRSGRRTLGGLLTDGRSSVLRYFVNNFRDGARQDLVDVFIGTLELDLLAHALQTHAPLTQLYAPARVLAADVAAGGEGAAPAAAGERGAGTDGEAAPAEEAVPISVFGVQLVGGSGGDTRDAYIKLDQQRGVVTTWTASGLKRRLPVHALLAAERSAADRRRLRLRFAGAADMDVLCPSAPLRELLVALLCTLQAQSAPAPPAPLAPSSPAMASVGAVAARLRVLCATVDCARPAAGAASDEAHSGATEEEGAAARCEAAVASVVAQVRGEGVVVLACFRCPLPEAEWTRLLLRALAPSYSLFASTAVGSAGGLNGGLRLCGLVSAEHRARACSVETAARSLPAQPPSGSRAPPGAGEAQRRAEGGWARGLACATLQLGLSSFCFLACDLGPPAAPGQPLPEGGVRELLESVPVGEERAAWHAQFHHILVLGDTGVPARVVDRDAAEQRAHAYGPRVLDGFRAIPMAGDGGRAEGVDASPVHALQVKSMLSVQHHILAPAEAQAPAALSAGAMRPGAPAGDAGGQEPAVAAVEEAEAADAESPSVCAPRLLPPREAPVAGVACARVEVACYAAPVRFEPLQPSPLSIRLSLLRWRGTADASPGQPHASRLPALRTPLVRISAPFLDDDCEAGAILVDVKGRDLTLQPPTPMGTIVGSPYEGVVPSGAVARSASVQLRPIATHAWSLALQALTVAVVEDDAVRGQALVGTAALPLGTPLALPAELRSSSDWADGADVSRRREDGHFRLALSRGGRTVGVLTGRLQIEWLPPSSLSDVYAAQPQPLPRALDVAHAAKQAVRPVLGAAAGLITQAAAEAGGSALGWGLSTVRGLARKMAGQEAPDSSHQGHS